MMTDRRYLTPAEAAAITGRSARYFQLLAADKKTPWAVQPNGPGTPVMIEKSGFNAWLQGGQPKWSASTGAKARRSGRQRSTTAAASTAGPLRQRIEELLKSARGSSKPG